jgi:hypothetical protein
MHVLSMFNCVMCNVADNSNATVVRVDWPCYASKDWPLAGKDTRIRPSQVHGKSWAASRKSCNS